MISAMHSTDAGWELLHLFVRDLLSKEHCLCDHLPQQVQRRLPQDVRRVALVEVALHLPPPGHERLLRVLHLAEGHHAGAALGWQYKFLQGALIQSS